MLPMSHHPILHNVALATPPRPLWTPASLLGSSIPPRGDRSPSQHCGLQGTPGAPEQGSWEVEYMGGEGGLLETLPGGPNACVLPLASHPPQEAQRESGLGQTKGAQRGKQGGDSPVGRAGHPRARRSSSHVPAMAHLRGGRTQLQT